jgi:4-amino-4-deoxy-L-arabinose transferase-like glycosyltransferase
MSRWEALSGLALLSKYTGVFLFVGVLLFLLTTPAARRWLATPGPWLGRRVSGANVLPVVWWNAEYNSSRSPFQPGAGSPIARSFGT